MAKSNQKSKGSPSRSVRIPLATLTALCACLIWLTVGATVPQEQKGPDDAKARARQAALRSATRSITTGFDPSLEMKENADFLLTPALLVQEALSDEKGATVRFDAIIELNAPLCRTYVVLFARYWVLSDFYRMGVVWGEPHAGSLNFPIYPPTLQVVSDANSVTISHQLQHLYDAVFAKPLGERGPFQHRFNSYAFSDIRFAEQEFLDLRVALRAGDTGEGPAHRRDVLLPARPITVGFSGAGPAITIAGETRRYSELQIMHPQGGQRYVVDYESQTASAGVVSLPVRIAVYSGDGKDLLRSVRLCNYAPCNTTSGRVEEEACRFSRFDANEVQCRELLVRYWMKDPREIVPEDVDTLRRLRSDFAGRDVAGTTVGERLKRVNLLLQLDWMLDDAAGLERDFRTYLSLLSANQLPRMTLFGGQNAIEITIRWGWLAPADTLLALWLDAAITGNDIDSVLDFADASLASGRFWTTAKLMDKTLADSRISAGQRFLAQALRCIALARILGMLQTPDYVTTELGIAQARWAASQTTAAKLSGQLKTHVTAAQESFEGIGRPTREDRTWKSRLDKIEQSLRNQEVPSDRETSGFIGVSDNEAARGE